MSRKPKRSKDHPAEIATKLRRLQTKLKQLNEVKALLREEGISPDAEDKAKESRLIQQILGIEKDQKRKARQKEPQKTEKVAFAKAKEKAGRQKRSV